MMLNHVPCACRTHAETIAVAYQSIERYCRVMLSLRVNLLTSLY